MDTARYVNQRQVSADPPMTVIELSGEIDAQTAPAIWKSLAPLPGHDVVVDLSGITFISLTGLDLLLALCADERPGATRRLAAPPRCVRRIIELTSTYAELLCWPTLAEARGVR
ncbi:STAS domain-containing protein [Actinokineospora sp. HUAS TT18]|uniref:STAS domain-containing protein n=1 Tax=Actinokineospora sp. HUAS TT18 TaxID=3447451 RepID=UPI003F51D6A4